MGRHDEAIKAFEDVASRAGAGTLYGRMARMGRADAQARAGQVDAAIATWKELMAQEGGELPADALLLELVAGVSPERGQRRGARRRYRSWWTTTRTRPYAPEARTDLQGLTGS